MEEGEHRLGDQIQNTIENHLPSRGDDVCTVRETPSYWVESPDKGEVEG